MTNPAQANARDPAATATYATTVVRVDLTATVAGMEALHPLLLAQIRELKLRTGSDQPDAAALLRLISSHYTAVDEERRGVVRTMQLMADEARTLALEAQEQSSDHLQIVLDNIKDVVLTLDEFGVVLTFNPTAERVFGYPESDAVGRRSGAIAATPPTRSNAWPRAPATPTWIFRHGRFAAGDAAARCFRPSSP